MIESRIVMLRDGGGSLDVRDSTLRWRPGSSPSAGSGSGVIQITGNHDDVVILRNDISGNPDGIQVAGDNWTIQENWIHDLAMVGTYPDNTHNDGIQIYNGSGHRIVSNRIEIGARSPYSNSPVFLQGSSIGSVERDTRRTTMSPSVTVTLSERDSYPIRLRRRRCVPAGTSFRRNSPSTSVRVTKSVPSIHTSTPSIA